MKLVVGPRLGTASFWTLVFLLLSSPIAMWWLSNTLGPSTEYHDPFIEGAQKLANGKYVAVVGSHIYVRYTVIRHKLIGSCRLDVTRYGEELGGPRNGLRHLFSHAGLRVGDANELLRPRWPLNGLLLTDELIPPGARSQELALYAVARYYCNPLDYIFPRYLQGGPVRNETERVNLIVKRREP